MAEAAQQEIQQGRGANYPIVFVNRGQQATSATIRVEDVPEGWSALSTEQSLELDPQSSHTVYVIVRTSPTSPREARKRSM